ncbi:MAG: hypothetical protein M9958_04340 [Chitinophagales bacterium]|nr:hypothetical protein [Chitinophagales bacterium]
MSNFLSFFIILTINIYYLHAQNCNLPTNMQVTSTNGITQFSWTGTEQVYIHVLMLWDKNKNQNSNAYTIIGNQYQANNIPMGSYRWRLIPLCDLNANTSENDWTWGTDFDVNVNCTPPSIANAGNDQLNVSGTSYTLSATNPLSGNGQWSIVNGIGGNITNSSLPNSNFTGTPGEVYTLRWTVNNACGSTNDDVNIGFSMLAPKNLGIYYGWPSYINQSSGNTQTAIQHFKDFDIIVLGDGIWQNSHGDHANTTAIISGLKAIKPEIKVFGYIDLSTTIQNLSEQQLMDAIDGWKNMGVTGVFGDDFGSDFGVTRARQNFFIDYAHSQNISVFANGWEIDDVLGGNDCHLSGTYGDYYLMEGYFVSDGQYTNFNSNIVKSQKAFQYAKDKGVKIACVARELKANLNASTPQTDKFKLSWHATTMYNFDAFQYTDKNFSSDNNKLFYFQSPSSTFGSKWTDTDVIQISNSRYERVTNTNTFYITGNGVNAGTGGIE